MKSRFPIKMLVALFAISLIATSAFAEEVGKITYIEGRVDIFKQNTEKAQAAREYDVISVGDSVRTKSNSKTEIKFKDDSILRLAQNSKITIKDYQLNEKSQRNSAAISLERGKVRTIVAKMPHTADFDIITPNAKGVVKGSDIFTYYQAGASGMLVAEGRLAVTSLTNPAQEVLIPAGSSVLIPQGQLPQGPRPYLDLEANLNEQDTNIPFSAARKEKIATITGTIYKFSGSVKVITKGQTKVHDAKMNEVIGEGDQIETGNDGFVEIRLDNNNAMNMKPNTKLAIIKLVFNPQTGEYENIFEVTIGKIKARVEGLKGKSKFEVKTPLAICGVRGTILYVNVSPDGTATLVEGGNGYMTHLISGITQNIGSGENSSADGQGGVTNPNPTTQEERDSFTEGWDTGNGTEGYSAPEGTTGEYLYNNDTDTNTGTENGNNTGNTGSDDQSLVDVPFSETNPTTTTTTTEPAPLSGDFLGNFAYYDSWDVDPDHWHLHHTDDGTDDITNGGFIGTGTLWTGSQSVTLSGNFSNLSTPLSWHDLDLWVVDSNGLYGTTTDGATFLGTGGGIRKNNSLKGTFYALYVRPLNGGYQAGYFSSTDLSGNIDSGTSGGFSTSGTLGYHDMGATVLLPQDISRDSAHIIKEHNEQGKVGGSDSFMPGTVKISGFDLVDTPNGESYWGIFRAAGGGSYTSAPTGSWSVPLGGSSTDDDTGIINAYWLGTFGSDNAWGSQDFSVTMSGTVLSDDRVEKFNGTGYGIYYNDPSVGGNRWEFLGAGESLKTAVLTSSGRFIAQGWGNFTGNFDFAGQIGLYGDATHTGYLRGADANPKFISIGEFNSGGAAQFAWAVKKEWITSSGTATNGFVSRLFDDSPTADPSDPYIYTTYDDGSGIGAGSLYGLSAGVGGNGELKGKIYSLYVVAGEAGVFYGSVDGKYYDGIEMYRLDGTLAKHLYISSGIGLLPEDLHNKISWDTLSGLDDDGGGDGIDISTNWGEGTMLNIAGVTDADGHKWGVWNLVAGGDFSYYDSGVSHNNWDVYDLTGMTTPGVTSADTNFVAGSWLGGIGYFPGSSITSKWSGGEIEGELRAIWIALKNDGTLSGRKVSSEVTGNYIEVSENQGTWQAASAGEWVEVTTLLDTTNPANLASFTSAITNDQFVSIPITEMGLGVGSSSFITEATMNLNLYAMAGGGDGIWAAIINGSYSVDPTNPNNWVLNLSNGSDSAILNGTSWTNGQWQGTMTINTSQGSSPTTGQLGQAAGTYTGTEGGTFTGAATGMYEGTHE